jgi:hypothetical protein
MRDTRRLLVRKERRRRRRFLRKRLRTMSKKLKEMAGKMSTLRMLEVARRSNHLMSPLKTRRSLRGPRLTLNSLSFQRARTSLDPLVFLSKT